MQSPPAASTPADDPEAEQQAQAGAGTSDSGGPCLTAAAGLWPDVVADEEAVLEQTLLLASIVDALEAEGRVMVRSLLPCAVR